MGSYLSCSRAATPAGAASAVWLVLPSGEVQRISLGSSSSPATAAEIMLEHPGHFVAAALSVRVGNRFAALPADEELEMGGLYVVVPMKRVGSVVSAADGGALFLVATSPRRGSGKAASAVKVAPEGSCRAAESSTEAENLGAGGVEEAMNMARYLGTRMGRSKKPTLETIAEETER